MARYTNGNAERVVHATLAGEGDADLVLRTCGVIVVDGGLTDLHVRCQHRVRRRQRTSEQDGRRQTQTPDRGAEHSDRRDGERHGDEDHPHRVRPSPEREGSVDLQSGAHERDQDDQLAHTLGELEMDPRVESGHAHAQHPCRGPDDDEHDRQGHRTTGQERRDPSGDERSTTDEEERHVVAFDGHGGGSGGHRPERRAALPGVRGARCCACHPRRWVGLTFAGPAGHPLPERRPCETLPDPATGMPTLGSRRSCCPVRVRRGGRSGRRRRPGGRAMGAATLEPATGRAGAFRWCRCTSPRPRRCRPPGRGPRASPR